jgi:hypothetical protein
MNRSPSGTRTRHASFKKRGYIFCGCGCERMRTRSGRHNQCEDRQPASLRWTSKTWFIFADPQRRPQGASVTILTEQNTNDQDGQKYICQVET